MARGRPPSPMPEHFWGKIERGGADECWAWRANRNQSGYGLFDIRIDGRRTSVGAHRKAWELTNGPIPDGLLVMHRCDNPPCCNPAHLMLGTFKDNSADMVAKGRNAKTISTHGRVRKLTDADVRVIRSLYRLQHPMRFIGQQFPGLNRHYLGLVARGKVKAHVI